MLISWDRWTLACGASIEGAWVGRDIGRWIVEMQMGCLAIGSWPLTVGRIWLEGWRWLDRASCWPEKTLDGVVGWSACCPLLPARMDGGKSSARR
ncbi:hypothetical protein ACLOJK_027386 [Asimina triloba]